MTRKITLSVAMAIVMLAIAMPCASMAATRHALVIGVGRQADSSWPVIHGDRDVEPVVQMLRANSYTDITTLVNEKATKNAIVSNFRKLAGRCRQGDVVYIHFSGHGQQMTDVNGDEDDGWDEAWIPYDACKNYCKRDRGERHLNDDEVGILLTEIRNKVGAQGAIIVVVDACHSGDSTRGVMSPVRGVRDRFVIPGGTKSRTAKRPEPWVTLSACRHYQVNQEYKGMGRLTYILTRQWRTMSKLDNRALLNHVDGVMKSRDMDTGMPQSPAINTFNHPFNQAFAK